jgi:hypothetical protein
MGAQVIRALALAAALTLAGCAATPGDFCDLAQPIRLSDATIDTLTDADVAVLVGHNRRGQTFCGWHP